jgi:DNA polymerase-3 subunit delta
VKPEQFLSQLGRQDPAPAYLFLGAEPYRRLMCRRALIESVLGTEDREQGLAQFDLRQTALSAIVDEARSLSLFAPRRLIWASNAEAALPRGRAAAEAEEGQLAAADPLGGLADYLKRPAPGVVVVLEASRYELEGEDKTKLERVRKVYSVVQAQVEFPRYSIQEARHLALELARAAALNVDREGIELLVESVGADAMRVATEIEKLRLYAGPGQRIGLRELAILVPDSSVSTIFVLVDALGRRDRLRALELLDTLVRQGEYMPLALSFLATLLRLALAAKERGLRSPQQIQQALSKPGRPVWRSKAEQIHQTATVFSQVQLETALKRVFATDRALRDARPDDRIVMEKFVLGLAD